MIDDLAVGPKTVNTKAVLKTSGVTVKNTVEIKNKNEVGVHTRIRATEDSTLGPHIQKDIPTYEIEAAGTVVLCVSGYLNGVSIKFLIGTGPVNVLWVQHSLRKMDYKKQKQQKN